MKKILAALGIFILAPLTLPILNRCLADQVITYQQSPDYFEKLIREYHSGIPKEKTPPPKRDEFTTYEQHKKNNDTYWGELQKERIKYLKAFTSNHGTKNYSFPIYLDKYDINTKRFGSQYFCIPSDKSKYNNNCKGALNQSFFLRFAPSNSIHPKSIEFAVSPGYGNVGRNDNDWFQTLNYMIYLPPEEARAFKDEWEASGFTMLLTYKLEYVENYKYALVIMITDAKILDSKGKVRYQRKP